MNWRIDVHKEYTGVTVVMQISLDRVNRIPFHLQRWKDPIVIVVFVNVNEMNNAWKALSRYKNQNLEFVLYVVDTTEVIPYFIESSIPFIVQHSNESYYPLNLLRDISIESITTTHFLLVDGDLFLSSTLSIHLSV